MDHLLTWIIFLPTIGAVLACFLPHRGVKIVSVAATAITLLLAITLIPAFLQEPGAVFGSGYGKVLHHVDRATWIQAGKFRIEYYVGVDGLGFPMVLLTALISFLACLASWNFEHWNVNRGLRGYFILFLILETGMLGVFSALDFFLFYIFWEVMLLPMYFLIGVWGGPRREYAAIKFFLYTLLGSILMLVAMLAFYFKSAEATTADVMTDAQLLQWGLTRGAGTFDLIAMATCPQIQAAFGAGGSFLFASWPWAIVMFIFLYIAFAVKLPIFPFHTWLPDAHVEAPTPISMILAGVLLKMGGYGLLRIAYPILSMAGGNNRVAYALAVFGVINIIYGALCAMAQTDFKKLVAYSSISHMGYVLLGIAVMTPAGVNGAMFQMLAHGISSPMCFFLVGVIYDRAHHREINRFGGLWLSMPVYGSMATLGFFASLGLPALCGFIGEVWVLLGTYNAAAWHPAFTWARPMAIIAAFGVVLTAGYILWLLQRVYLGPRKPEYAGFPDASVREMFVLAPMGILAIVLGVLPQQTLFRFMSGTLDQIVSMFTAVT
jgi:NADH-quinone oxidoreductase subunit M